MKVAIIGTVGVPANYGGFETLVENLLTFKQNSDIEYTVYCSSKAYKEYPQEYKGAKLVYVPFKANGYEAFPYDTLSLIKALKGHDVIISMGCDAVFLWWLIRLFTKKKLIIHFDGLDFTRDKFNGFQKKVSLISKKLYAKYALRLIADNQGIVDYIRDTYHRDSDLIEYGGDNAKRINDDNDILGTKYGLEKGKYCFKVARIEPENNIQLILEAFEKLPEKQLVIVGNWNRSEFGREIRQSFEHCQNIKMLDPIYEPKEINLLRSNCGIYIHGHSVGGTNPSLVEAMSLGLPIFAFDVVFNRATMENNGKFFNSSETLRQMVQNTSEDELKEMGRIMKEVADRRYTWAIITDKYEKLFVEFYNQTKPLS